MSVSRADTLLAEAGWIQQLARQLAGDTHEAADIAQESYVQALRRGPPAGVPIRAWLKGLVRNVAWKSARADQRRRRHERGAARAAPSVDPTELQDRAALHKQLVDAVLALPDIYRTAVLLRYFDGLSPREIAARLELPVRTVETRLHRGLQRLRRQLDRHYRDRKVWTALVLIETGPPPMPEPRPWRLAALPAAGLTVAALAWATWPDAEAPSIEPDPAPTRTAETPRSTIPRTVVPESRRVRTVARQARRSHVGRVFDVDGTPLAGFVVEAFASTMISIDADGRRTWHGTASEDRTRTDARGTFELLTGGTGYITSTEPGWTTVCYATLGGDPPAEGWTIAVAPTRDLSGIVVDDQRRPVAGARVDLIPPRGLGDPLGTALMHTTESQWTAVTGTDGRFGFDDAPHVEDLRLEVTARGHVPVAVDAPFDRSHFEIVAVARPANEQVGGRVLDDASAPVAGAVVGLGNQTATTDDRGEFVLDHADGSLVIAMAGWRPLVVTEPRPGTPLTLRLRPSPLSLSGRVVDERGKPLPLAVGLADPAWLAPDGDALVAEGLAAGGDGAKLGVATDRDGRFVLSGLADRDYHVRVFDSGTAVHTAFGPFPAGATDVEIRVPDDTWRPLYGRVLLRDGTPLGSARVLVRSRHGVRDGIGMVLTGETQRTDEAGRFAWQAVARDGVVLWVHHPLTGDVEVELSERNGRDIVLPRQLHLRLARDPSEPPRFDHAHFLDGHDRTVLLNDRRAMRRRVELPRHGTLLLGVPETARAVVFSAGGVELERQPVALDRDEIPTILF